MNLNINSLQQNIWKDKNYSLPLFDINKMREETKKEVKWVHFGAGNIFRGFPAARMQNLLNNGDEKSGIVVGEGFDFEIIEKIYDKYDNLCLLTTLKSDSTIEKTIIASVAESYKLNPNFKSEWNRFCEIFSSPALQMVSFTITEKGYSTKPSYVKEDIKKGPKECSTIICMTTALTYERYKKGELPFALVSMDNCAKNGDKLKAGILEVAKEWVSLGLIEDGFINYLNNKVGFPWSMIDKITPRPDRDVIALLKEDGFEDTDITVTSKNTWIAPFVNAEECEYLVIEDNFPNGKIPLDKVGIFYTDRDTVNKVEKMKVGTCLNPLHTAMSIMGVLLGYDKISKEMMDEDIVRYISQLGYIEGLACVVDPKIISPKKFIDEVINSRLSNPFLPDTPQRISCDTSQKLGVRFSSTAKHYIDNNRIEELVCLPLVYASWFRYLMGVDDDNKVFEISPDPLLEECKAYLKDIKIGDTNIEEKIKPLMMREDIFNYDLYSSPIKNKVIEYFTKLIEKQGSVRFVLHNVVNLRSK